MKFQYLLRFLSFLYVQCLVYQRGYAQILGLSPMIGPNAQGLIHGSAFPGMGGLAPGAGPVSVGGLAPGGGPVGVGGLGPGAGVGVGGLGPGAGVGVGGIDPGAGVGGFGLPIQLGNTDGLQGPIQLQDLRQRFQVLNRERVGIGRPQNFLERNGNRLGILTSDAANQFVESVRGTRDNGQADTPQINFNQLSDVRNRFGGATGRSLVHQLSPPPERSRSSSSESGSSGQSANRESNNAFQSTNQGFNLNDLLSGQNIQLPIQSRNVEFPQGFPGSQVPVNSNPVTVQLAEQPFVQASNIQPSNLINRPSNLISQPSNLISRILGENSFPAQFLGNGAGSLDVGQLPFGLNMLGIGI